MKNNFILPEGVNPEPFFISIQTNLANNLDDKIIKPLANMLAIDYANRLADKFNIEKYTTKIAQRLKNYLGHKVITNGDFSTTMSLFAVAITDINKTDNDKTRTQNQEQDILLENIIITYFGNLSKEEQIQLKEILKNLIVSIGQKEIFNFINSNPKLFYSIVFSALREKHQEKERLDLISLHINRIIKQQKSIDKSAANIKSLTSKFALATGLAAAASIGNVVEGTMLPGIVIPATLASIKLAPAIGKKLGKTVAQNISSVKRKETNLKDMIKSIMKKKIISVKKDKKISKEKISTIEAPLKGVELLKRNRKRANSKTRQR